MEMDYNLKKNMANFFMFFLRILEKLLKLIYILFFIRDILNTFLLVLYEQFHVREKALR